jgi:hypothetical protein
MREKINNAIRFGNRIETESNTDGCTLPEESQDPLYGAEAVAGGREGASALVAAGTVVWPSVTVDDSSIPVGGGGRWGVLDRVRGLAVVCMIVDHLCLFFPPEGGPLLVRLTVGRLAMPLFFVLAGYLARRLRWRHLSVALLGVALPVVCPWLDHPNVLTLWALGCVCLWLVRWAGLSPWLLVLFGLAMGANGFGAHGVQYEPTALWGLMAAGSMLRPSSWRWGLRLPCWLELVGRYPVSVYAGQALILTAGAHLAGVAL